MLVAMLIALLVTAWLVVKSLEDTSSGKQPAAVKSIERADQARRKMESSNSEQERKLDNIGKD
jgi:F0F1-type ATP synthase membrane subunit b/b'